MEKEYQCLECSQVFNEDEKTKTSDSVTWILCPFCHGISHEIDIDQTKPRGDIFKY